MAVIDLSIDRVFVKHEWILASPLQIEVDSNGGPFLRELVVYFLVTGIITSFWPFPGSNRNVIQLCIYFLLYGLFSWELKLI